MRDELERIIGALSSKKTAVEENEQTINRQRQLFNKDTGDGSVTNLWDDDF